MLSYQHIMDTGEFLYPTQNSFRLWVYSEFWLLPQPLETQICSQILVLFSQNVKWMRYLMLLWPSEHCSFHLAQCLWDHQLWHKSVICNGPVHYILLLCFILENWGDNYKERCYEYSHTCFCPNVSLYFSRLNLQQRECSIIRWIYFHLTKRKTAVSVDPAP